MKTPLEQLPLPAYARLDRKKTDRLPLYGFVLAANPTYTLLAPAYDFVLNGFCVIRNKDVTQHTVYSDPECFTSRALQLLGVSVPSSPDIDIASFVTVAQSAAQRFPLIVVHCERRQPDACWVGRYRSHTKKRLVLDSIDPSASWDGTETIKLRDVTMIGFGALYESALWLVAQEREHFGKAGAN
jgi:hypothetical protein